MLGCIYRHGACVERWKSTHGAAQREAIRGAAVFQAGPNGSRVNPATRDCQQRLSPHLLNKWRDLSKKARRTLTDDHSGGEKMCVYVRVWSRIIGSLCTHSVLQEGGEGSESCGGSVAGVFLPAARFQRRNFQVCFSAPETPPSNVRGGNAGGVLGLSKTETKRCIGAVFNYTKGTNRTRTN